jgi:CheY-like chemotaxis protein
MALHFSLEQIARLRDDTRQLVAHAADAETDLNALLMQSQNDSPATQRALRSLCVLARQHHVALGRLAIDLGDRHVPAPSERPRPRAVLVVDDYPDSREWLSFLLQNAGFVVRTASNGLEAVLAAHQLQPTVIVMDLTMPVLDGMEATRLIKAIDQLRDVKVIAYTARPPDQQPAAEGLFAAILSKPAPPDEILATVQRYALPLV